MSTPIDFDRELAPLLPPTSVPGLRNYKFRRIPLDSIDPRNFLSILASPLEFDKNTSTVYVPQNESEPLWYTTIEWLEKVSRQEPKGLNAFLYISDIGIYGNVTSTQRALDTEEDLGIHNNAIPVATSGPSGPMTLSKIRVMPDTKMIEEYSHIVKGTNNMNYQLRPDIEKGETALFDIYPSIFPYETTRVHLVGGQYINADWLDGGALIACQFPTVLTARHMWQMVWDTRTTTILVIDAHGVDQFVKPDADQSVEETVALKGIEIDPEKDSSLVRLNYREIYWPHKKEPRKHFPEELGLVGPFDFNVELISAEARIPGTVHSILELTHIKSGNHVRVDHYHFIRWPDVQIPSVSILPLLLELEAVMRPIIIHCQAGIGRAGTAATLFVAMRHMREQPRVLDPYIDIRNIVWQLRHQRYGMVSNAAQYVFCYHMAVALYDAMYPHPGTYSSFSPPPSSSEETPPH
jgi:protein tyrosine phosphatase